MKLYVGNLPYSASEVDLEGWFAENGVTVDTVTLVRDRFTGEARGFAFVEIENDEQAEAAIQNCNGKDLMGRAVVVNEARPKTPSLGGMGGGGGAGGGGDFGRDRRKGKPKRGKRRPPRW